ncbi:radial spoke head 10 homolog B [Cheilinus undulatus]|uniref:radial spoke head 10 homolog B n=1 Tax=Cheilinus undulatus TaxID=241271 RepID=UPI001BD634F0|nr:radial spoke head 10 homolog B [Cheilinus undulatus]
MDNNHEPPSLICLTVQRYEGEMCEDQFQGEGLLCFEGGHVYKGMFSKGLMEGRGVFTCASGLKYEGEFISNQPLGKGTYTWPDGSFYKGEVFYGLRHGTGTYTCAKTGVSYTGQWDQGKRHGKGEVYYNQDKTSWYKGDWVKNNREGCGVRHYPSGNIYSGEWKNNLRHGEGTMKWLKEGEEYVGMWKNGVQHGQGTLTWILRRTDGSQYIRSNQYTGDFVQGQRHGHGTFHYASGAFYEGEWRNNKKHGKGKFSHRDGRVFEGQFMDDKMMANILNGNRMSSPFCGLSPLPGSDSSVLGPDMVLNINCLLDKFPERDRDTEQEKVELMVLKLASELRSIYSYYSRLGQAQSPDNTFQLSRLQLWRLLKDCYIHHHGITLAQIDHLIRDTTAAEIHSPFTPILLHGLLSCLVVVAYHIYHKDMMSQKNLLAACFSKLMADNILPNAKNVKGFLFRQSDCAVVVMNYVKKCMEIYQTYCKVLGASSDEQSMTCRHLLWMFKDLHLLDNKLTVAKLLQIITSESSGLDNFTSCVNVEITFLEFLEVLLGSAEVKCRHVSEGVEESESQSLLSPDMDRKDQQEAAEKLTEEISPSVNAQELECQQDANGEVHKKAQSTGEHENEEGKGVQTKEVEAKVCEQKLWLQTVHQFFNNFFFPAYEHDQLVSKNVKEKLKRESHK